MELEPHCLKSHRLTREMRRQGMLVQQTASSTEKRAVILNRMVNWQPTARRSTSPQIRVPGTIQAILGLLFVSRCHQILQDTDLEDQTQMGRTSTSATRRI